jgi:hypothetical protein
MGFFFLGHGTVMTVAFGWGLPVDIALDLDGKAQTGTVSSVALNPSHKINRRIATRITYRYSAGGESHENTFDTIDGNVINRARTASSIAIEVFPSWPSWSRIAGERNAFFGYLGAALALEPIVGLPLLLSGLWTRRRARKVWRDGVAVEGRVVSVTQGRTKQNRRRSQRVTWEYLVGGVPCQTAVDTLTPELMALAPGQQITVIVDPTIPGLGVPWIVPGAPAARPAPHPPAGGVSFGA